MGLKSKVATLGTAATLAFSGCNGNNTTVNGDVYVDASGNNINGNLLQNDDASKCIIEGQDANISVIDSKTGEIIAAFGDVCKSVKEDVEGAIKYKKNIGEDINYTALTQEYLKTLYPDYDFNLSIKNIISSDENGTDSQIDGVNIPSPVPNPNDDLIDQTDDNLTKQIEIDDLIINGYTEYIWKNGNKVYYKYEKEETNNLYIKSFDNLIDKVEIAKNILVANGVEGNLYYIEEGNPMKFIYSIYLGNGVYKDETYYVYFQ